MKPLQCSHNHPGLVDPPCHAQGTPHLLEGNWRVPAAHGMGTVQTQQIQASLANANKRLREGVSGENSRGLEQWPKKSLKNRREKNKPTIAIANSDKQQLSASSISPEEPPCNPGPVYRRLGSPCLYVAVWCFASPKTTEAAPAMKPEPPLQQPFGPNIRKWKNWFCHIMSNPLSLSRRSRLSDRLTEALGTSDQGTSAQANCKVWILTNPIINDQHIFLTCLSSASMSPSRHNVYVLHVCIWLVPAHHLAPVSAPCPAPAQPPTPAAASGPDVATSAPPEPSSAGASWRPCHACRGLG